MSKRMFFYKIIVGLTIITLGFIIAGNSYVNYGGKSSDIEKYGGDAYTGIQNAASTTANNVNELGDVVAEIYSDFKSILGIMVITIGALYSGYVVIDALDKKIKPEQM